MEPSIFLSNRNRLATYVPFLLITHLFFSTSSLHASCFNSIHFFFFIHCTSHRTPFFKFYFIIRTKVYELKIVLYLIFPAFLFHHTFFSPLLRTIGSVSSDVWRTGTAQSVERFGPVSSIPSFSPLSCPCLTFPRLSFRLSFLRLLTLHHA